MRSAKIISQQSCTLPDIFSENEDPVPTFSYLVKELRQRHPDLAYLHVVEPRFGPTWTGRPVVGHESNAFLRDIWRGKPYIVDSGFTRDTAIEQADADENTLVAFGRYYTSNVRMVVSRLRRTLIAMNDFIARSTYSPSV